MTSIGKLHFLFNSRIVQKEDELKALKKELEALLSEKDSLQKIEKEQSKAMNSL